MTPHDTRCDIFCRVVDNFGDIGVTWRLARQLASEHQMKVRLFVDDLASFQKIEPAVVRAMATQTISGVNISGWDAATAPPASLVIEAFGVNLPEPYVRAMAGCAPPPVWINLEYLSAESWVATHHLLPSPHPQLPLCKYFFFPGFTKATGSLIRERDLIASREAYQADNTEEALRILLFGYPNRAAANLLGAWERMPQGVRCLVPAGALAAQILMHASQLPQPSGKLAIVSSPFCSQADFDRLLWDEDVLFVRGEDSFVRAQWAAKPFVWQIYPQDAGAHWVKLEAFLALYCRGLDDDAARAVTALWHAWNAEDAGNIAAAWDAFARQLPALQAHAKVWANRMSAMPDLAANLLSFYRKTAKI